MPDSDALSGPVVANPIDLAYAFSDLTVRDVARVVWREGADPSIVRFRDRYYLFVSMSGGFWHSDDLASWRFVATPDLPILDYAPDVCEIDGALVLTASKHDAPCSFWRSTDPLAGAFEEIPGSFAFWDPCLFQDDDGRVYLYWGCAPDAPLHGVELDRTTFQPIGDTVDLFGGDHLAHGWEWPAECDGTQTPESIISAAGRDPRPWVEGAWMTKHAGTYHLQYGAPGTQYNLYGDGCYVAASPLGPFTYAPDNPFSSVPGGFAAGAGHGSTVQDRFGNWWHAATIRISVQHAFERRIGIYPAGFDDDGVLFCNQEFADHPFVMVQGAADPWADVTTGWRLLSYRRPVSATSSLDGHGAELVVDEDIRTIWVAARNGAEEGVTVDLGAGCTVRAVQVNLAEHDTAAYKPAPEVDPEVLATRTLWEIDRPVPFSIDVSIDGITWHRVGDSGDTDSPHRLVLLDGTKAVRFVRVLGGPGAWGSHFGLRGVRVFGSREGDSPSPAVATAVRLDDRTAHVSWSGAGGADGVNVRYGRSPDKLYHSWLVYGRDELVLPTLSAGIDYWVAADAVNGTGITRGEAVRVIGGGGSA